MFMCVQSWEAGLNVHACGWRSEDNLRCYSSDTLKSGWNQSLTGLEFTRMLGCLASDPQWSTCLCLQSIGNTSLCYRIWLSPPFNDTCLCVGIHTRAGAHRKGARSPGAGVTGSCESPVQSPVRAVCSLTTDTSLQHCWLLLMRILGTMLTKEALY